jgi:hypothetical protein
MPLLPPVTVIQLALLEAVQEQPVVAVTAVVDAVLPEAGAF